MKFSFTFLMIYAPLLFMYSSGISGLTILDVLLLLFNITFLFQVILKKKVRISVLYSMLPIIIYLSVWLVISINSLSTVLRTLRYLFYLLQIYLYNKGYFDSYLGINLYKNMSLFSSLYIYIQVFIKKFYNFYLPGTIPGIKLMQEDLKNYTAQRPLSLFEEPSHFAIYVLGYFTILLFQKEKITLKIFCRIILLTIAIFLSSSFLGIIVLCILVFVKIMKSFFKNIINGKINLGYFLIFLIFLIFILAGGGILRSTKAFKYLSDVDILIKQASGRFEGYCHYFSLKNNLVQYIFGRGMVGMPEGVYYSSYILILYYFGFIGLLLFMFTILFNFKVKDFDKFSALIICLLGLGIGSELILGRFILLYYPLISARKK